MLFQNETILDVKTIRALLNYFDYINNVLLEKILRIFFSLIIFALTIFFINNIVDKIMNMSISLYVIYQTLKIPKCILRNNKIKYIFYNDFFSMNSNTNSENMKYEDIQRIDNTERYCYITISKDLLIIDNSKFAIEDRIKFKSFLENKKGEIKMRKYKKVEIGADVIYEGKKCKVIAKEENESVILVSVETNEKIKTKIEKIKFMEE